MKHFWTLLARYRAHDDPLAAAGNLVALVIGFDQPFYPLTLYWATGADVTWSLIDFLSAPCFLAVPFVMRRSSLAGRVMLVVVGTLDTLASAKVFGTASGAELYFGPCLMLAAMLFRKREQLVSFVLIGLTLGCVVFLHGYYGDAWLSLSGTQDAIVLRVNTISVAMLTVFIAVVLGRARGDGRDVPIGP